MVHHVHRITLTGGSLRKLGADPPVAETTRTDLTRAPSHPHALAAIDRTYWPS